MMALRLSLLTVFVMTACGQSEGAAIISSCQLSVDVIYPTEEGAVPSLAVCSSQCPRGDDNGLWYEGVTYKRISALKPFNLMVEATFENGQLKGCKMVPYATTEELIAQQEAQQAALNQCLGVAPNTPTAVPTTPLTGTTFGFVTDTTGFFAEIVADTTGPVVETTTVFTTSTVLDSTIPPSTTPVAQSTTTSEAPSTTPVAPNTTSVAPSTTTSEAPSTTSVAPSTTPLPSSTTPVAPSTTPVPSSTTPVAPSTTPVPSSTTPVAPSTTPVVPFERCGEGFTRVGDTCYMVSPTAMSMMDGAKFCNKFGATPASIDSQKEQDLVKAKLSTDVWIGLNDIAQEGRFLNQGRTDVGYTNWNNGEPNNYNNNEDCTMMIRNTGFRWNDDNCNTQARILCEHSLILDARQYTCPQGYLQRKDSCYRLGDKVGDYAQGEQFCSSIGAYPVFINSQAEQDFLAATVTENVYIGLSDRATEGTFRAENFGVALYTSWYDKEPNNIDNEDCTELNTGYGMKWNDCKCDQQKKVLCEVGATRVPIYTCPDGTAKFEESACFLAAGNVATGTYKDAVNFCNAQGMSVATIRSPEEQAFAAGLLKGNTWIDLTDAATESVFVWGDGSPLKYTSFGAGEPNDLKGLEDCVEMNSGMGYKWNDESCFVQRQFLCKTATFKE